jgi:hypothetical protein
VFWVCCSLRSGHLALAYYLLTEKI